MYGWYSKTQQKNICERLEMQAAARHFPKRTHPYIYYIDKEQSYNFQLKNKRNVDRKSINLLRNEEISSIIE